RLIKAGITPNEVTCFAVVISVGFAAALAYFHASTIVFALVPAFLLVRMALNAIDGMMAREANLESPQGVFLNELGDVVCDLALFFAFCSTGVVRVEPTIVFAILAMLSEMAGLGATQVGARRGYEGPMGKSDRAVLASALAIAYVWGVRSPFAFDSILAFGSLALVLTIFNRIRSALGASASTQKGATASTTKGKIKPE
ncbi:MAG: CDP-alcohol phosphatidyltransferase family protein, partial [Bdellovibrionota bacterium]